MRRGDKRSAEGKKTIAVQLELGETAALERLPAEAPPEDARAVGGQQLALPGFEAPVPPPKEGEKEQDEAEILRELLDRKNQPLRRPRRAENALARLCVPEKLRAMAERMPVSLYIVGGAVRNFLLTGVASGDWDIAAPCSAAEALEAAKGAGLKCVAVYPRTDTFRLKDGGEYYEFTAFRTETYAPGGGHSPAEVRLTGDIYEDAVRRDFKCNAVYYDVAANEIVDPLGGKEDVLRRTLSAARAPREVFGSDGLRLMRLCRFAGELGFEPDGETLAAARRYADNVLDIAPERVYEELTKILAADGKYRFSPPDGHLRALETLDRTGVLDRILPELAAGRGMAQRADFHKYDVLSHSLRAAYYAPPELRLAALLHDAGKPAVFRDTGRYYGHDAAGAAIAAEILARLKAPARVREKVSRLTALHMYDLDGRAGENKLRLFFAANVDVLDDLMALRQADYRACRDASDECPTLLKWRDILARMRAEGAPFAAGDLAVNGEDLAAAGLKGRAIGETLAEFLRICVVDPARNDREKLLESARRRAKKEEER